MTSLTTPDNIVIWTGSDPQSLPAASSAEGTSVQAAFAMRQRYGFVWANAAARTAQTGMVTGSQGYQLDTKSDYIDDGTTWALKTPHAEFTASTAVTLGSVQNVGTFTYDATQSTSSTFVTPVGSGQLNIVDPGIYAVSSVSAIVVTATPTTADAVTGRAFLDLTKIAGVADQQRVSINTGEDRGSLSKANLRVTVPNQSVFVQYFVVSVSVAGATINTRVSITRLG